MCQVYAGQDPAIYSVVTRSVRLHGYCTSVRLEAHFWSILDEMAAREGLSTPRFISKLYDEVMELRGEVGNFTSLLRVSCAVYVGGQHAARAAVPDAAVVPELPARSKRIPPSPAATA